MLLLPDKSLSGKSRAQITALIPLIVLIHAYFFVQMKKGRFHTCPQNSDEKRIIFVNLWSDAKKSWGLLLMNFNRTQRNPKKSPE